MKKNGGDIKALIQSSIKGAFEKLGFDVSVDEIAVTRTQDASFGDYTTSVALSSSKILKRSPMEIGEALVKTIGNINGIEKIDIVKPGFLNFTLSSYYLKELIYKVDNGYGVGEVGKGRRVMVEFGQPNTHKAMTLGHFKSAITGLSVVRLYEQQGYQVVKANFFGDIGMHVAKCLWGVIADSGFSQDLAKESVDTIVSNLKKIETNGDVHQAANFLDACYVKGNVAFKEEGDAQDEIKTINRLLYDKTSPAINALYEATRDISIRHQDEIFAQLGVKFDRQYPESEVYALGIDKVKQNLGKVFIEDDGAIIFPGEKYKLNRWVFLTKEGNPTYSCKDMGLAFKKFEEYPDLDLSIYTTSVEQIQYFKAVFKALELIDSKFEGKCRHIPFGWLLRSGKKMSSKGGATKFVEILSEAKDYAIKLISESKDYSEEEKKLISERVAIAGLKFAILSHEFHKDVNYDPDRFFSFTGYSGPYVLYSLARANSVIAKAAKKKGFTLESGNISGKDMLTEVFNHKSEIEMLRIIEKWPDIVNRAASEISPHLICNYLFDLSNSFNLFYNECPVIDSASEEIMNSRVRLIATFAAISKSGLNILGIEPLDRM